MRGVLLSPDARQEAACDCTYIGLQRLARELVEALIEEDERPRRAGRSEPKHSSH
jgi:hypothetical protein